MKPKTTQIFLVASLTFVLVTLLGINVVFPNKIEYMLASVILSHNFKSAEEIKIKEKVRILIVPGHEPNFGGAEFGNLKERDMTLELGQDLQKLLEQNPRYQVFTTRENEGWSLYLLTYFKNNWNEITKWTEASRDEFTRLVSVGSTTQTYSIVKHADALPDVALHLYGITKWANEHDIDITLHIHFNDYAGHKENKAGKYSGFSIYVPAQEYGNSTTTKIIVENIFKRLKELNKISNLPGETEGVINEPELIAIGANNTANSASVLIEYGYIYEPRFQNAKTRSAVLQNLAEQTYRGLEDFFETQGL